MYTSLLSIILSFHLPPHSPQCLTLCLSLQTFLLSYIPHWKWIHGPLFSDKLFNLMRNIIQTSQGHLSFQWWNSEGLKPILVPKECSMEDISEEWNKGLRNWSSFGLCKPVAKPLTHYVHIHKWDVHRVLIVCHVWNSRYKVPEKFSRKSQNSNTFCNKKGWGWI